MVCCIEPPWGVVQMSDHVQLVGQPEVIAGRNYTTRVQVHGSAVANSRTCSSRPPSRRVRDALGTAHIASDKLAYRAETAPAK